MLTGWQKIGGEWYYFHADGTMAHDMWIDGMYYVDSSGAMLTNTRTPDGYQVGTDGKWFSQQAIIKINAGERVSVDVNNDGIMETVRLEEFGEFEAPEGHKMIVYVNSNKDEIDIELGSRPSYLMKTKDKTLLYVCQSVFTEYQILTIFDISSGIPKILEEDFKGNCIVCEEESFYDTEPTNINDFTLINRAGSILTNNDAYRNYHIGEVGLPVANSSMYKIKPCGGKVGDIPTDILTAKREVPAFNVTARDEVNNIPNRRPFEYSIEGKVLDYWFDGIIRRG